MRGGRTPFPGGAAARPRRQDTCGTGGMCDLRPRWIPDFASTDLTVRQDECLPLSSAAAVRSGVTPCI